MSELLASGPREPNTLNQGPSHAKKTAEHDDDDDDDDDGDDDDDDVDDDE